MAAAIVIDFTAGSSFGEAQPTEHPELIAGPWEVASASEIDGIFFEIVTSSSGPSGHEQFDWQTMNIRVYQREEGRETWGYFGTKDKATPQSYSMQDDQSFIVFDEYLVVGELLFRLPQACNIVAYCPRF
jgi:hypothetical protein